MDFVKLVEAVTQTKYDKYMRVLNGAFENDRDEYWKFLEMNVEDEGNLDEFCMRMFGEPKGIYKNEKSEQFAIVRQIYNDLHKQSGSAFRPLYTELGESFKIDYSSIKEWVYGLNIDKRTPRGMKKEHELLQYLKRKVDSVEQYMKGVPDAEYEREIMLWGKELLPDADIINDKFGNDESKPTVVVGKYATYTKSDASAYKRFETAIKDLEKFLGTLKGYHAKPLKGLKINFVKKTDLRGKASYKTDKDELWINLQSMGKTQEDYGSLPYVVVHELGHRYLRMFPQKWNYDASKWITTKYSRVDSFSGEEKFAELFAITHWKNKYSEFKDVMSEFEKMIK